MNLNEIKQHLPDAVDFLKRMIYIPSFSGEEKEVIQLIYEKFEPLTNGIEFVPLPENLPEDPEYSTPIPGIQYKGRHNLRAVIKGTSGGGPSVIFNTHADVVPASANQTRPFEPFVESESVYGRGACDAKGQIATLYLLSRFLMKRRIRLKGDIIFLIVVEEENGGNGSLAAIRKGEKANATIVMEPSSLKILPSVRGAVWFRIICKGKPGHSGSAGKRISALDLAIEAREILIAYHQKLLAASKGIQLFDDFENPMPITFGKLLAGDWPATIPNQAVLEGVLGFLPNKNRFEVMDEIKTVIYQQGGDELKSNVQIEFMYKHDSHVLSTDHLLVRTLSDACKKSKVTPKITAMAASCDSWLYQNQLKIPTVVFGPGDLAVAHSNYEHIKIKDIELAAKILVNFVLKWCG
jgi:acetylornithine deacetylase